jgi:hypothetical protein
MQASHPTRAIPGWALVAFLIAILTYPVDPHTPNTGGYDVGWITALNVAAQLGRHWGSQLNSTYGPLGFLATGEIFYDRTGIAADLLTGALYLGPVLVVTRGVISKLGLAWGALMMFVLTRMTTDAIDRVELLSPLMVVFGVSVLRREEAVPGRPLSRSPFWRRSRRSTN